MRPSPSLIKAIKAVELVLTSDAEEISELTQIAAGASGIPAERILLRMNLGGLDLRGKDIGFLLDKETVYGGATLTRGQREEFARAAKKGHRGRIRRKIRAIRIDMISRFIDAYEARRTLLATRDGNSVLPSDKLRTILLEPIRTLYAGDLPIDTQYMLKVLKDLELWVSPDNMAFFGQLCTLLGDLRCPVNMATAQYLTDVYGRGLGNAVGDLVALLQPNEFLDSCWITHELGESMMANARQISNVRPIHPVAVEKALDEIADTSARVDFLSMIKFDCNNDEAERIAARITRARWPASETQYFLRAQVHPKVRGAIFRQLLRQGEETRVIEVLRWLDGNRGAVGALSLEGAFMHIKNFGVGIRFAEEAGGRFADNQLDVVVQALRNLATTDQERQRLAALCKRFDFDPYARRQRR